MRLYLRNIFTGVYFMWRDRGGTCHSQYFSLIWRPGRKRRGKEKGSNLFFSLYYMFCGWGRQCTESDLEKSPD